MAFATIIATANAVLLKFIYRKAKRWWFRQRQLNKSTH